MEEPQVPDITTIQTDLAERIQAELGQNVYLCYQCIKCTSGCPLSNFFDWQPNQIMRAIQFGQEDIALESQTPWLCAACQTCTTRCPQNLDINAIMEFLTREAGERGIEPQVPEVGIFNEAFMREVKLWGRSYELGVMGEMKLRTGDLLGDLDLGMRMLPKGKLAILPSRGRRPRKVKPVSGAATSIAYYPGCSLHSTATELDTSTRAVCDALGLDLVEPKDWLCCGSSAAHRVDPQEAVRLPMENLSMIEEAGFREVTMPCAACFNRHKTALFDIREDPQSKAQVEQDIGRSYQDRVQVNTLLDTILGHVGIEELGERVTKPLEGLAVVSYYGCLLTRPPQVTEAEHPENPTGMDELLHALGAEVHDWSYKTSCCGAAHFLTRPDIVLELGHSLIDHAREAGAEVIAVACPLCHANLDARQFQMELEEPLPILYFTQLMALALGLPEKAASLNKNLVDPRPYLHRKGFV